MVQQAGEKPCKKPANRAQRPMIWEDSMAEVKETFRRVAMVKHSGFSVWDDPRRGPTLEKILRWNRQARNLSQVPKSLREKIPTKVLKEIQNNRSVTGYISQAHLQNVKGMCQRISSQKSLSERRKNVYDPSMYPVFVRRPPTMSSVLEHHSDINSSPRVHRRRPHSSPAVVDSRAPLSYTPQPFKLLYDISNGSYPKRPRSVPSSSGVSCYGKLFNRSGSSNSRKSSVLDIAEAVRASSAPGGSRRQHQKRFPLSYDPSPPSSSEGWITLSNRSNTESDSRPPSRCASRPPWRLNLLSPPALEDLSHRSTYSDCVSVDSMGMPVLFSSSTKNEEPTRPRVSVPKLRLRGGDSSPRKTRNTSETIQKKTDSRPSTANVPILSSNSDALAHNWRPQSASNAVGRRGSRVTFASPVESEARGFTQYSSDDAPGISQTEHVTTGSTQSSVEGDTQTELVEDEEVVIGSCSSVEIVETEEVDDEDVIIKHSADPYYDFKSSMLSMIDSEGLKAGSKELEDLFQYYVDLNPKMHHPILARVFEDIKSELMR